MQKIIPFKKDIVFKTNLSEITSISLEHSITNDDYLVHGTFTVSGRYKITDTSTTVDDFNFELPFEIKIDDHYDVSKIVIDIDDFYYEIINNNTLSVNIDVLIDKLEEKELEEHIMKIETLDIDTKEDIVDDIETIEDRTVKERCIEEEDNPPKSDNRIFNSLFDNLDSSSETYQSYHVYIVREGDTLEKIMQKYGVTKEELEDYNDLSELKINDKIVVPKNNAED